MLRRILLTKSEAIAVQFGRYMIEHAYVRGHGVATAHGEDLAGDLAGGGRRRSR
jgi:hypothetical protein